MSKTMYIGTSFFYEPKNLWIDADSGSGDWGLVPHGSEWFWPMLEGPRGLRSVPYDPGTLPGSPQLQYGIGNGQFACLGGPKSQIQYPKNRERFFRSRFFGRLTSEVSALRRLRDIQMVRSRCRIGVVGTQGTFLGHREPF